MTQVMTKTRDAKNAFISIAYRSRKHSYQNLKFQTKKNRSKDNLVQFACYKGCSEVERVDYAKLRYCETITVMRGSKYQI